MQAQGADRRRARGGLLLIDRRGSEKILEADLQAFPGVHPQHQRPGTFPQTQLHVAGNEAARSVNRYHVPPQSEHHSLRLHRAQSIPEKHLIERDDVCFDGVDALLGRGLWCDGEDP